MRWYTTDGAMDGAYRDFAYIEGGLGRVSACELRRDLKRDWKLRIAADGGAAEMAD